MSTTVARILPVVIIDTNILLDIFVFENEAAQALRDCLSQQQIDAVICQQTLNELNDVIGRPQFNLTTDQQKAIETQWLQWARLIDVEDLAAAPWKCKDRADQIFIDLAYSLRPSRLISKDLQVLKLKKRAEKEGVAISKEFILNG
jgi:putative PIN family toxin of toxin-antitoxin system